MVRHSLNGQMKRENRPRVSFLPYFLELQTILHGCHVNK